MKQFVLSKNLDSNRSIVLSGKDFRYLIQVRRMQIGDELDVCTVDGNRIVMRVSSIITNGGNEVLLVQTDFAVSSCNTVQESVEVWLFQWLTKNSKFDGIVRQATEMGVSRIIPVLGEFCIPDGAGNTKQERWQRIIREARQQSGSLVQTTVDSPCTVQQALEVWKHNRMDNSLALLLCEQPFADNTLYGYLKEKPEIVALAIGAEGGISVSECDILMQTQFMPLHFKTNILRAETASLYAVAAVQSALMEYDSWHVNV